MSNVERQRRFRALHPGYYRKYKARRAGDIKTLMAAAQAAGERAAAFADLPLFAELAARSSQQVRPHETPATAPFADLPLFADLA